MRTPGVGGGRAVSLRQCARPHRQDARQFRHAGRSRAGRTRGVRCATADRRAVRPTARGRPTGRDAGPAGVPRGEPRSGPRRPGSGVQPPVERTSPVDAVPWRPASSRGDRVVGEDAGGRPPGAVRRPRQQAGTVRASRRPLTSPPRPASGADRVGQAPAIPRRRPRRGRPGRQAGDRERQSDGVGQQPVAEVAATGAAAAHQRHGDRVLRPRPGTSGAVPPRWSLARAIDVEAPARGGRRRRGVGQGRRGEQPTPQRHDVAVGDRAVISRPPSRRASCRRRRGPSPSRAARVRPRTRRGPSPPRRRRPAPPRRARAARTGRRTSARTRGRAG